MKPDVILTLRPILLLLMVLIGYHPVSLHALPTYTDVQLDDRAALQRLYDATFPADLYQKEREVYQEAVKALNAGREREFQQKAQSLMHYPLYPYLRYYELRKHVEVRPNQAFVDYFQAHQDTLTARWLKNAWIQHLGDEEAWALLAKHSRPSNNSEVSCYFYRAMLHTGQEKLALAGASKLWMVGRSQPKACDPLFQELKQSPHFGDEDIWQRAVLAIKSGNPSLANYLGSLLPDQQQALIKTWLEIRRDPPRLLRKVNNFQNTEHYRQIVLDGLSRIAFSDLNLALSAWDATIENFTFSPEALLQTQAYIARLLAFDFHHQAGHWLEKTNLHLQHQELFEYQIRFALREMNWGAALQWINLLDEETRASPAWRYWEARALQQLLSSQSYAQIRKLMLPLGTASPPSVSKEITAIHTRLMRSLGTYLPFNLSWYSDAFNFHQRLNASIKARFTELSRERSYYGFLASQYLSKPVSLNENPIIVNKDALEALKQLPGFMRARELLYIGDQRNAQREWIDFIKTLTPAQRSIAARLAEYWNWPFHAIFTASRSDNRDDIDLRFPRIFHHTVSRHAANNQIAAEWVYSIIRQESAFKTDAKSSAGALGVMQLMPRTARYVGNKIGVPVRRNHQLLDPDKNIRLGSSYLKQLLDRFNGNQLLATAAYNAGPSRSDDWIPIDQALPGDVWIETIPIKETRGYVKNVIAYQTIYRYQLGLDPMITQAMAEVAPLKQDD